IKTGFAFTDLFDIVKSKTDTNLGLADRFHQGYNDPQYFWNYRYMKLNAGMWLSDPWHHPALQAGVPIKAGSDGDPLPHTEDDKKARIESVTAWDDQGLASTNADYRKYHPFSLCSAIPAFDENSSQGVKPQPENQTDNYWRVIDNRHFTHSFVVDLRQTPYEL